ncbi:MAG: hypothetical protein H6559_33060 [Lewinellaceae bacterium]|nr:hypothetical protein [Lewinellaceae bacterium]
MLEAEELSFRFGLMSLFSSKIKVRSVVVSNGALNIEIDRQGNPNYDIFVESEGRRSPALLPSTSNWPACATSS